MISMIFGYEALKFVSYINLILVKSCRLLAVLIIGVFKGRPIAKLQLITAGLITIGVIIYNLKEVENF